MDEFVFSYHDGEKKVFRDPQELHRGLLRMTQGQLGKLLADAQRRGPDDIEGDSEELLAVKARQRAEADSVAFPAIEALLTVTREVFKMKPFDTTDGSGATERACHKVLNDFFLLLEDEKKNGPGIVCSPPSSASAS